MATREGEYFNILCVWIAPLFGICLDYDKDTLTVTGKNKIANTIMKSFNNSIFFQGLSSIPKIIVVIHNDGKFYR